MKTTHLLLPLFLLFLIPQITMAQELRVKEFVKSTDILHENDWKKDRFGDYCALVKVRVPGNLEKVDGNLVGDVIENGVEKWLFMTSGTKTFRLYVEGFYPLEIRCGDFGSVKRLEGKSVYILTLLGSHQPTLASDPLVLSDSVLIKKGKDWYLSRFEVNIPFKSTVLQRRISKALFGDEENSLEMAYRKHLTNQDELKSLKAGKMPKGFRQIVYTTKTQNSFGHFYTFVADYARIWKEKSTLKNVSREYTYIYDDENDKILTLSDVLKSEMVEKIEKQMSDNSQTYQMSLSTEGVTVRLYKKGKNNLPIGEHLNERQFRYEDDKELLLDEFCRRAGVPQKTHKRETSKTLPKSISSESNKIPTNEDAIFEVADNEPLFPGGKEALLNFFESNIRFPSVADKNHIDGVVNMTFVVEKDGSVSEVITQRSTVVTYSNSGNIGNIMNRNYAQLFIDAVKSAFTKMPHWQAAKKEGKQVRLKKYLSVTFGQAKDDTPSPNAIQVFIRGEHSFDKVYKDDKKPFNDMHLYRVGQNYFVSGINKEVTSLSEADIELLEKNKAKAVANDILKVISFNTHPDLLVDFTKDNVRSGASRPLYKGSEEGLDEYMKKHLNTSFDIIYVKASFVVETNGKISCPIVEDCNDLNAAKMVIGKLRKTKKWQPALIDGVPVRSRLSHVFSYKTVVRQITPPAMRSPVYNPYRQNNWRR